MRVRSRSELGKGRSSTGQTSACEKEAELHPGSLSCHVSSTPEILREEGVNIWMWGRGKAKIGVCVRREPELGSLHPPPSLPESGNVGGRADGESPKGEGRRFRSAATESVIRMEEERCLALCSPEAPKLRLPKRGANIPRLGGGEVTAAQGPGEGAVERLAVDSRSGKPRRGCDFRSCLGLGPGVKVPKSENDHCSRWCPWSQRQICRC